LKSRAARTVWAATRCCHTANFNNELDDAKKAAAESPGHWQLAQDAVDQNSNVVFHAYDHVETVLDESNAALLAQCTFESNSIYVFDNTVNRDRIVASWWRESIITRIHAQFRGRVFARRGNAADLRPVAGGWFCRCKARCRASFSPDEPARHRAGQHANATSNLNLTVLEARPMLTNFTAISGQMIAPGGVLNWALGTNGNDQVQGALTNVNALLIHADTNLSAMLIELSGITSICTRR